MSFNSRLRKLIQQSDLKYLSKDKRKKILEDSVHYKIPFFRRVDIFIANEKVKEILDGEVFKLSEKNKLNYHNMLLFSNLFNSVEDFTFFFDNLKHYLYFDFLFKTKIETPNIIGLCKTKEDFLKILESLSVLLFKKHLLELEKLAKYCNNIDQFLLLLNNRNILELIKLGRKDFIKDFKESVLVNKKGMDFFDIYNLDKIETVSKEERQKNIKLVNDYQKQLLKKYNVNISDLNEKQRSLVLYYRKGNEDDFIFFLLTHILQRYIETGKSKIFNKLKLTSRYKNEYPEEIKDFKIDYFFEDFKRKSTIFANIIHLSHSTVVEENHEYMETSFPIIALANFADKNKSSHYNTIRIPKDGRYIKLNIKQGNTYNEYGEETEEYPKKIDRMDKTTNFKEVFNEIIKAIQELEDKMLEEAKEK